MIRSIANLTAASKQLVLVPDTIVHDGITWSKASLAPFHQAWFYADGKFLLAREDGIADADAKVYAPTDEVDMGETWNRYGTDLRCSRGPRFMAADQVTEAQVSLPVTEGLGSATKSMQVALADDLLLSVMTKSRTENTWQARATTARAAELTTKAKASRVRAENAQERLYKRIGKPRGTVTINWQSSLLDEPTGPVAAEAMEQVDAPKAA